MMGAENEARRRRPMQVYLLNTVKVSLEEEYDEEEGVFWTV